MLDLFLNTQSGLEGITPVGLLLLLFFGTFVSEDAACLLAGTAVAAGKISPVIAVVACFCGILTGDLLLFGVGHVLGQAVFHNPIVRRFVSEDYQSRAKQWINNNAMTAVFASRFISGLRLPTYLLAGSLKTATPKFAFYFALAAGIWTPLLVGATAFSLNHVFTWKTAIALVSFAILLRQAIRYSRWKNRRLLIGKIKRIMNWEFWPVAVFYTPIILYVLFLGIRYRSLTLFTSANLSMPAGGFVGESKEAIYKLLSSSPKAESHLLKFVKIDASQSFLDRLVTAVTFIHKNELEFPLVLKPDAGERGRSVKVIRDKKQLGLALKSTKQDLILQEFVSGVEASIFYYRFPSSDRGNIFSITEKIFPFIRGDRKTTIEELILKDTRAVCLSKSYFENLRDRLNEVPRDGELVQLIEIGTHSKGAIFMDGERLITEQLENAVDDLCRCTEGFYFGRFDVRANSFEELVTGCFKIIELNGVSSESTNIYDPKYSLFDAYRILFRQWKLAFVIGAANRSRGAMPVRLRQFIKLVWTKDASIIAAETAGDKLVNITSPNACA